MTPEELKSVVAGEVATLKESLKHFAKSEDIQKEIATLKATIEANNIKGLEDKMGALEKAAEIQGLALTEIQTRGNSGQEKSFRDQLAEKAADLANLQNSRESKLIMGTTRKAVTEASSTSDTMAYRDGGVGQIQRGIPWLRDLFPTITLGSNTHGDVKWFEQLAITNNAANVAEVAAPASASDLTWIEKTLGGKRLKDYIKVSKDQLKDIDFVAGEVQGIINKNMRLLENSQLYNGTGLTTFVKGINTYAPAFDATGITIQDPNLFDIIAKAKTQIKKGGLDAFNANVLCLNPDNVDALRLAKNADGDYLFPQWAIGGVPSIAGLNLVENTLVTTNTMLLGDFNYGTVFVWDNLTIEMGYIGDDFLNGYVTIMAYERLNLRVKDTDVKAFVKVADIAASIAAITPVAP